MKRFASLVDIVLILIRHRVVLLPEELLPGGSSEALIHLFVGRVAAERRPPFQDFLQESLVFGKDDISGVPSGVVPFLAEVPESQRVEQIMKVIHVFLKELYARLGARALVPHTSRGF